MTGKIALGALLLTQASGVALAQSAETTPPSEVVNDENVIIVTAQKRAENVQDVPISIVALGSDQLQQANVSQIEDLETVAPNFTAKRGPQVANFRLNVRGVGAFANNAVEPSVASYVDGVYVPRPGTLVGNMLDIASVEVLRGPQGTLFGRNASVGALSLRTATPEPEFSGRVSAEAGNGDRYKVDGYINLPASETLSFRLAGLYQAFDGYWTNELDGQRFGGSNDLALRLSARLESGPVDWIIRGDYARSTGDGVGNVDFVATSVTPAQLAALQARLGGRLPDTNFEDRRANQVLNLDLEDSHWGVSSDFSYDFGALGTLRLVNSFRDWDNSQLDGDILFLPVAFTSRQSDYGSKSHNHELQFLSPTGEWLAGRFDLVAGLYYFQEDYRLTERLNIEAQFCNVLFAASAPPVVAQRNACNAFLAGGGGPNATNLIFGQSVESLAAYAQGTFRIVDRLALTGGMRYTHDDKSARFDQTIATPFAAPFRSPEVLELPNIGEGRFTYRVGLTWEPSDDILLFATYTTGYKSAGYNSGGGSPAQTRVDAAGVPILDSSGNIVTTRVFDRETVKNYEIGAKTSWLDGALIANLTFYRMDIEGFQDRAFDGVTFSFRNAGNLRQQGFEFDTVIRPIPDFTIRGSLAYLDSAFTDYRNGSGLPGFPVTVGGVANPAAVQNLNGLPNAYSPELSGSFSADWQGDLGNSGLRWRLNGNLSFTGDHFTGGTNDGNPQTIQDGYALLGGRATIEDDEGRWSLSVFGTNLTDAAYCQATLYQPLGAQLGLNNQVFTGQSGLVAPGVTGTGSTAVRCFRGDPRTYGVSASFSF
ncbi:TonB-dependent receptor [Parerythrobacter aurantius]|uniref:TonB-dependent receptor n=1 Tax=Parerythrobacter aurantius TaxID=3127706 RepID=UPI0032461E3C